MFISGTDKVVYQIDSVNTSSALAYNPEAPPDTTLHLDSFQILGENGDRTEDAGSRTKIFSGLLELILRLRTQGDVYVVDPPMLTVGTIVSDGPYDILRGKQIPSGMETNLLFGGYRHTLTWFTKEVNGSDSAEDVCFGEIDSVTKCANTNAKAHSNYAVGTDHILASLHRSFMFEDDASKANALQHLNAAKSLTITASVRV